MGAVDMVAFYQPAGAFPDPPADDWKLQVLTHSRASARLDFGAGRFAQRVEVGQMALSTSGTSCEYELTGDHGVIALALPGPLCRAILEPVVPTFDGDFGPLHTKLWRNNGIRDAALSLWQSAARGHIVDADDALLRLLVALIKAADRSPFKTESTFAMSSARLRRVLDFIDDAIDQPLPLFRLAAEAAMSPYHFARSFREDTGDTPHRYVMRRRIARATDLLRFSRVPIAEVALAAGFSSQQRLSDALLRHGYPTAGRLRRETSCIQTGG